MPKLLVKLPRFIGMKSIHVIVNSECTLQGRETCSIGGVVALSAHIGSAN